MLWLYSLRTLASRNGKVQYSPSVLVHTDSFLGVVALFNYLSAEAAGRDFLVQIFAKLDLFLPEELLIPLDGGYT